MKTVYRLTLWSAIGCAMILSLACSSDQSRSPSDDRLYVVATTGMIADAARNVGGDKVLVDALMGPGVDPHLYKATQGDLVKLQDAEVILYNGLFLEGKMADILGRMADRKKVKAVGEAIPENERISFQFGTSNSAYSDDPHIWFDVSLWQQAVQTIAQTLSEADPDHADEYRSRADTYSDSLAKLHVYVQSRALEVPESDRLLLTAHDAFGYFGKAYGFDVTGLQGISTASDYGLRDIQRIVDMIVDRKIKAVFVESSVSTRSINAVVEGARQSGHDVKIGGTLFSDAMGAADTPEGTYIGMVRHNIDTIVDALK